MRRINKSRLQIFTVPLVLVLKTDNFCVAEAARFNQTFYLVDRESPRVCAKCLVDPTMRSFTESFNLTAPAETLRCEERLYDLPDPGDGDIIGDIIVQRMYCSLDIFLVIDHFPSV